MFAGRKERAAAEAFYQNCNFAPLWLDKGVENPRAASVIARLNKAGTDGLEPREYKPPNFTGLDPDALAEAELKLTHTVLTYARHVQAGRFPYSRVSRNIELPQAAPEPAHILSSIADAADAAKALDAFSPQHEPYRKLKARLAELRGKAGAAKSDVSKQIETIIANMERWRWYPRDFGRTYVLVNHPEFTLKVIHGGAQVWTTRIVIGHPSMADAAADGNDQIHHRQSDLARATVDEQGLPFVAGPGSDGARPHGHDGELQRWGGAAHPSAA